MELTDLAPFIKEFAILCLCSFGIRTFAAAPIRVAIIDTGIDTHYHDAPLCPHLSRDFTGTGLMDTMGHGTHVSDTIDQYAKGYIRANDRSSDKYLNKYTNYCQVIIKFYNSNNSGNLPSINAFAYAIELNVDVINYSAGGGGFDQREFKLIETALNKQITIVTAAGNDGQNLDAPTLTDYAYFPAQYDSRLIVVGALNFEGLKLKSSNWGTQVKEWELGQLVFAQLPHNSFGYYSGTSQATAIRTGKIIRKLLSNE